jgi:protein Tex
MTVDLEAIARRTNCEPASLRSALPLLEQGYAPPFLARYRRDELGGLSEQAMWTLYRAMRDEAWIKNRREDLAQRLEQIPQADPALTRAVRSASSKRVIDRLARRVRTESADSHSPAMRVAARILSPEKGDPTDIQALAELLGVGDSVAAIEASLDQALAARLAGHPQMQATAVRWLVNNAKISVLSVKDSHTESASASEEHDEESAHAVPGSSVGDVEAAATSTEATAEVAAVKSVDSFGANLLPEATATVEPTAAETTPA